MDQGAIKPKVSWRPKVADCVLLLVCSLYLIQYSDRGIIATAADSISRDLHLSKTQLGFAFSAFAYPYAFQQLFGGWLRPFVISIGLLLVGIAMSFAIRPDKPFVHDDSAAAEGEVARA